MTFIVSLLGLVPTLLLHGCLGLLVLCVAGLLVLVGVYLAQRLVRCRSHYRNIAVEKVGFDAS